MHIMTGIRMQSGRKQESGFSLVAFALFLLLIGAGLTASLMLTKANADKQTAADERAALLWADKAITGFAATNSRLPCPAKDTAGVEDCSVSKGYLPYKTLGMSGDAGLKARLPMRYMAYKGTDDLTVLSNSYVPSNWDDDSSSFTGSTDLEATNGLDYCATLQAAAGAAASTDYAHVIATAGTTNVAYGIAVPGSKSLGGGDLFEGKNASVNPEMEMPGKAVSDSYNDRVLTRGFGELASAINCTAQVNGYNGGVLSSVDTLARAADITAEVHDQAADVKDGAETAATMSAVQTALSVVATVLSAVELASAIVVLAQAIAALAAAIAACIASLGLACGVVAGPAIGVGLASGAVVSAGVGLALNAVATVTQGIATGEMADVASRAGAVFQDNTDTSGLGNPRTPLANAASDATTKANTAQSDYDTKAANLSSAWSNIQSIAGSNAYTYTTDKDGNVTVYDQNGNSVSGATVNSSGVIVNSSGQDLNQLARDALSAWKAAVDYYYSTLLPTESAAAAAEGQAKADLDNVDKQIQYAKDEKAKTSDATAIANWDTVIADLEAKRPALVTAYSNAMSAHTTATNNVQNYVKSGGVIETARNKVTAYYPKLTTAILDDYFKKAGEAYSAQQTLTSALDAKNKAVATLSAYDARQAGTGTTPGAANGYWDGAETILQQGDAQGIVN